MEYFCLSSECDNRLFRIIFQMPKLEKYPFLKASTPPIRCISMSHNTPVDLLSHVRKITICTA
ncbi:hypothetical protein RchiOBHm_Chr5g0028901 [Rosa chinensis]|uniref:Uncharacterized protein n=1 Tax=Rosa chinensis TaxID=74649 RepID=A0A2P6Q9H3_ROSCH|nr:hypothetical protein RchiOBHm_Chr5g0028901 [Rosa chinensis]